jgi:hypothetical protein
LLIGEVEIGAVLLVLPTEMSALPNIGEARAAVDLRDALLEGVGLAGRVGVAGSCLTEEVTQIDEVLLRRLALGPLGAAPLVNELLGGSCGESWRFLIVENNAET